MTRARHWEEWSSCIAAQRAAAEVAVDTWEKISLESEEKKVTEDLAVVGDPFLVIWIGYRILLLAVGIGGRDRRDKHVRRRRTGLDVLGEASTLEGVGDKGVSHAEVPLGEFFGYRRKAAEGELGEIGSLRHGDGWVVDWIIHLV
jgi:hypothetical protein